MTTATAPKMSLLDEMLLEYQTWTLEAYLATAALVWGIWVLLPFESFTAMTTASTALSYAPEWMWGVIFTVHGSGHWAMIYRQDPHACYRAALAASFLWGVLLVSFAISTPTHYILPFYAVLIISSLWVAKSLKWRFG